MSQRSGFWVVACLFLSIGTSTGAQEAAMEGHVVAADSGESLDLVQVELSQGTSVVYDTAVDDEGAFSFPAATAGLRAQADVTLSGRVRDAQGLALPGATVELRRADRTFVSSTVADRAGAFTLSRITPGDYVIVATLLGFEVFEQTVTAGANTDSLSIMLEIGGFAQEVTVTALMPEVATEFVLSATQIEKRVSQDLAASLREHPGVTALRRGPINLDPALRGLYAEQIGVFVDGTRTFAAGPARMDSELSHVGPHALQALRVVKGPYALTWGAGTLSAVQAETFKPAFSSGDFRLGGRIGHNYGGNGDARDSFAGLWGSSDRIRFVFQHNARTGNDYTDGDDGVVPGDYESFDTRWDLGTRFNRQTLIEYSGGYQKQNDIDYPGRILDATFFETHSHAVSVSHTSSNGLLSELAGQFYLNLKDHLMNNDNKPSARDMPGRMPPFGLRVDLPASSDTMGGRFHVGLRQGAVSYKLGFDAYRLEQSASRSIFRRSNDFLLFSDIVWPDARVTNAGGYAQAIYDHGRATIGGTLRLDHESAQASAVSHFFNANTTGEVRQNNTNVSAAGSVRLRVNDVWSVNLGIGRAVRNPSVLERYSDRFPAIKFQVAAEFLGNPALVPEKSLEFNVGMLARVARATFEGDFFYRNIDDYITVRPDASLARRLPLSPPVVFRYIQGDAARFVGYDLRAASDVGPWVEVRGSWSYVWAEDTFFNEPLFGISPFEQRYGVQVHTQDRSRWLELALTSTATQSRVAVARLEVPTEGWTTVDLQAGILVVKGVNLRAGVQNLTNEFYANHLNSFNPFAGQRIAEVGRNAYIGMEYGF